MALTDTRRTRQGDIDNLTKRVKKLLRRDLAIERSGPGRGFQVGRIAMAGVERYGFLDQRIDRRRFQ